MLSIKNRARCPVLTTFALGALVALRTGADGRRRAVAAVEALRETEGRLAVLARIAHVALADVVLVAVAVLAALQTAFWIGSLSLFSLVQSFAGNETLTLTHI